jgi:hypothetical protein
MPAEHVFDDNGHFADQKVVITGGLGFVGSTAARRLVALGARVTLVDSLIPQYGGNLFNIAGIEDSVRVNVSDVRDEYSLRTLVQGQDYLLNLAGQTSHMDSMEDPFTDLDINCRSQLSISSVPAIIRPSRSPASTRQRTANLTIPVTAHLAVPSTGTGSTSSPEWHHILYNNVYGAGLRAPPDQYHRAPHGLRTPVKPSGYLVGLEGKAFEVGKATNSGTLIRGRVVDAFCWREQRWPTVKVNWRRVRDQLGRSPICHRSTAAASTNCVRLPPIASASTSATTTPIFAASSRCSVGPRKCRCGKP